MKKVIDEIQIIPVKPKDGLVGFASLVLNNELYLSSIGIFTKLGSQGYRLTYPTRKVGNKQVQIFHPINREVSKQIEDSVLAKAVQILSSV